MANTDKILRDGLARLKDTNVPPSFVGNNNAFLVPFLTVLTEEVLHLRAETPPKVAVDLPGPFSTPAPQGKKK